MYSATRLVIDSQEARIAKGIRKVVSRTKGIEKTVDAKLVDEAQAKPGLLLDELEGRARRIETLPRHHRQHEHRDGREQRRPADVAQGRLALAPLRQDEGGADQRQKGQAGENSKRTLAYAPTTNQLTIAATPINMANA